MVAVPLSSFVTVSPEVADALANGRAVVALESTIITHGMPYPQNLEMAGKVEARDRTTALVLSGGNVDPALFSAIIEDRFDPADWRKAA